MSMYAPGLTTAYLIETADLLSSQTCPVSISCWVKLKSLGVSRRSALSLFSGYALGYPIQNTGVWHGGMYAHPYYLPHAAEAELNVWHHLLGVWDVDNEWRGYLDGADEQLANPAWGPTHGRQACVGIEFYTGIGYPFHGLIAEATIWEDLLTAADAATLASGEWAGNVGSGLVCHLPLIANPKDALGSATFQIVGNIGWNRRDHPTINNAPAGTYPQLGTRLDKKSHKWQRL